MDNSMNNAQRDPFSVRRDADMRQLTDALQDLQEMVNNAQMIWGTGRCMVDKKAITDNLELITRLLPDAVKQASAIVKQEQKIRDNATREASEQTAKARVMSLKDKSGAKLTICDCTAYEEDGVYYAGAVTGGNDQTASTGGGCIFVRKSTELVIYDGRFVGNSSQYTAGCILTQVSDVEDETNGLVTFDRKVVKVQPDTMQAVAKKLQEALK